MKDMYEMAAAVEAEKVPALYDMELYEINELRDVMNKDSFFQAIRICYYYGMYKGALWQRYKDSCKDRRPNEDLIVMRFKRVYPQYANKNIHCNAEGDIFYKNNRLIAYSDLHGTGIDQYGFMLPSSWTLISKKTKE